MSKTVAGMISYIDEVLPNAVSSDLKVTYIDESFKNVRRFTPDIVDWTTQTVADQQEYDLPNNINVDDIISLYICETTYNTTTVVGSTMEWLKYKFAGREDRMKGNIYYRGTTEAAAAERIGLSPLPDDVVYIRAQHWDYPQTSNGSTTIIKNDYMIEYIQNKVLAKVARTGAYPRVDLSNNYEIEAQFSYNNLMREHTRVRKGLQEKRIGYRDWW